MNKRKYYFTEPLNGHDDEDGVLLCSNDRSFEVWFETFAQANGILRKLAEGRVTERAILYATMCV